MLNNIVVLWEKTTTAKTKTKTCIA